MGDDGPGVPGIEHVDAPDELEEGGGMLRHAVIRPRRELELFHLTPVRVTHLVGRREREREQVLERVATVATRRTLYETLLLYFAAATVAPGESFFSKTSRLRTRQRA